MDREIRFEHAKVRGAWQVTSPQIPGWMCTAPARQQALARARTSLRSYLRYAEDLEPWVRRRVEAMVLG